MNDFRQPNHSDFAANQLPTLNARLGGARCIMSEQFDTQRVPLGLPGYSNALLWPAPWAPWSPDPAVLQFAFVDATEKCGVIGLVHTDPGGESLAGFLRPWPALKNQAALLAAGKRLRWLLFARLGAFLWQPNDLAALLAGPEQNLLVSCDDLLAVPGGGQIVMAGNAFQRLGVASAWSSFQVQQQQATLDTYGARTVARMDITYDPAFDLTAISPVVSGDGVGFVAPSATQHSSSDMTPTVFYKGLPKVLGFAGRIRGAGEPEVLTARMDYVHVFGGTEDEINALSPAVAEGGQRFTL